MGVGLGVKAKLAIKLAAGCLATTCAGQSTSSASFVRFCLQGFKKSGLLRIRVGTRLRVLGLGEIPPRLTWNMKRVPTKTGAM